MISKPILTRYTSRKDINAQVQVNKRRIQKGMRECKNNFIFPFLNAKEYPLHETLLIGNQIMVVYKNGKFEVLPSRVNGMGIKDYLGIRYSRIVMWTPMPAVGSAVHPIKKDIPLLYSEATDLYGR